MKESDNAGYRSLEIAAYEAGYGDGYRVALERISNLRDIEKVQQEVSDLKTYNTHLIAVLDWLVNLGRGISRYGDASPTKNEWNIALDEAEIAIDGHRQVWSKPKSVSDRKGCEHGDQGSRHDAG